MRPSAQPFLWKWVLFAWEWKIISISKAEHLTSFWYRGPEEIGNGQLFYNIIEALSAAVNLKFYFYSARSRQYASMSTRHFFFYLTVTASSSGASFFAWQRRAWNEWLVMNRKGPWEGYRRQAKRRLARCVLPAFLCAHIFRETSGYEAVTVMFCGRFPHQRTSERRAQKFHPGDASLPRFKAWD